MKRSNPVLIRIGKEDYIGFIDEVLEFDQSTKILLRGIMPHGPEQKSRNILEMGDLSRDLPHGYIRIYKNKDGYDAL